MRRTITFEMNERRGERRCCASGGAYAFCVRVCVCVNACVRVCVSVLEMTLELMFNGARRKEFRKVPPRITIHGAAHVRHRRFGNNEVIVFCVCVCVVAVGGGGGQSAI